MPERGHDCIAASLRLPLLRGGEVMEDGGELEVRNPENNELIGSVARGTPADAERAVRAAVAARPIAD